MVMGVFGGVKLSWEVLEEGFLMCVFFVCVDGGLVPWEKPSPPFILVWFFRTLGKTGSLFFCWSEKIWLVFLGYLFGALSFLAEMRKGVD